MDLNRAMILNCPRCGSEYAHQGRVEVFERRDDAESGVHVVVDGEAVTVDTSLKGNPSDRRQGMRLWLTCEQCPAEFAIEIAQHKGNTFVDVVEKAASSSGPRAATTVLSIVARRAELRPEPA